MREKLTLVSLMVNQRRYEFFLNLLIGPDGKAHVDIKKLLPDVSSDITISIGA